MPKRTRPATFRTSRTRHSAAVFSRVHSQRLGLHALHKQATKWTQFGLVVGYRVEVLEEPTDTSSSCPRASSPRTTRVAHTCRSSVRDSTWSGFALPLVCSARAMAGEVVHEP